MKVSLFLMSKKGLEVLKSVLREPLLKGLISNVIVARDENMEKDYADEIIERCKKHGILCHERGEDFEDHSDYSIAVSWRWIINSNNTKLIVLHDSLLPRYRGFAPLVNMLINQEKEIGVTAIYASDKYDKGDIIAQSSRKIKYPIKISKAIDLLIENYVELVKQIMFTISRGGKLKAQPQDDSRATYSLWRDEMDYIIDWRKNSHDILNFINALSFPYKGASSYINGKQKIRILEAKPVDDVFVENRKENVGKVIFLHNQNPVIVCGDGLLELIHAIDDQTKESIIPFKRFRTRLTSFQYP